MTETEAEAPSNTGPELLDERSIIGIAVHLIALFTGILGAGLIYLVSDHEYTRTNARHALNWHVSVLVLTVVALGTFFLGVDDLTIGGETVELALLPEPLGTIVFLIAFVLLILTMLAWFLTGIFALIATVKAIFGTPWEYPFAREFVERFR